MHGATDVDVEAFSDDGEFESCGCEVPAGPVTPPRLSHDESFHDRAMCMKRS